MSDRRRRFLRKPIEPLTAARRALKHLNSLTVFTTDERGEACIRGGRKEIRRLVLAIYNLEAALITARRKNGARK